MEADLLAEATALHIEGRLFADTIVVVFFIASSLHCIWIKITTFVFLMINFVKMTSFVFFGIDMEIFSLRMVLLAAYPQNHHTRPRRHTTHEVIINKGTNCWLVRHAFQRTRTRVSQQSRHVFKDQGSLRSSATV